MNKYRIENQTQEPQEIKKNHSNVSHTNLNQTKLLNTHLQTVRIQ